MGKTQSTYKEGYSSPKRPLRDAPEAAREDPLPRHLDGSLPSTVSLSFTSRCLGHPKPFPHSLPHLATMPCGCEGDLRPGTAGRPAPSTCPFDLRERHRRRAARREESARRAGPSLPQGAHSAGRPLAAFRVEPQARRHARGGGGAAGGTRGRSARCPRGRAHLPLRAQQPRVRPAARRPRRRCSRRPSGLRPAGAVPARGSSSVSLARK